jgi:hypothetical protein
LIRIFQSWLAGEKTGRDLHKLAWNS